MIVTLSGEYKTLSPPPSAGIRPYLAGRRTMVGNFGRRQAMHRRYAAAIAPTLPGEFPLTSYLSRSCSSRRMALSPLTCHAGAIPAAQRLKAGTDPIQTPHSEKSRAPARGPRDLAVRTGTSP